MANLKNSKNGIKKLRNGGFEWYSKWTSMHHFWFEETPIMSFYWAKRNWNYAKMKGELTDRNNENNNLRYCMEKELIFDVNWKLLKLNVGNYKSESKRYTKHSIISNWVRRSTTNVTNHRPLCDLPPASRWTENMSIPDPSFLPVWVSCVSSPSHVTYDLSSTQCWIQIVFVWSLKSTKLII